MSARFRIRTPQGQELSFGSEEMFADFVRSGDLSPEDLVYDATTGEWCSAHTHSLVLELRSSEEGGTSAAGDPAGASAAEGPAGARPDAGPTSGGAGGAGASAPGGAGMFGLELSPERTPEQEAAAFLEEMQAERASEIDRYEAIRGLEIDDGGTGLLKGIPSEEAGPVRRPPPRDVARPPAPWTAEAAAAPKRTVEAPAHRPSGRDERRPRVSRSFVALATALGLAIAFALLGSDMAAILVGVSDLGPEVAEGSPLLPDTEEALRARAATRFLARTRDDLVGLPAIPPIWLDGRYLSDAGAYPQVRDAWNRYLQAVESVRANEARYYRDAYLSALDDARVTGATRTLRLASAQSAFADVAAVRARHYDRLRELAVAAVALHDFLVAHAADIEYEPAVGLSVSADPVLQAAAPDPVVQAQLEERLDRVLDALTAGGDGPVEARAVPAWAFGGLRDIVDPQ